MHMLGPPKGRLVGCILPPSLLLSSANPTPDHRFESPPGQRAPVPQGHLAAPSWLLIISAHSVVACAWEEPGGAPAETASNAVTRLSPQRLGAWSPATLAVKGARPTRSRPPHLQTA